MHLQIEAPKKRKHSNELIDLIGKTYSAGLGYWNGVSKCENGYLLQSNYDWKASRVGFFNGEMVSHFGIWKFDIRVGGSTLRVAGVGAVATHEHYRNRGFVRATGLNALENLASSEYDISLLYGVPSLYEKLGYARAWPVVAAVCPVDPARYPSFAFKMQKSAAAASPIYSQLYNEENQNLTGTAIHPTFPKANVFCPCEAFTWFRGGKSRGYFFAEVTSEDLIKVKAWAGDPGELMAALTKVAVKSRARRIRFEDMHLASRMAAYLRLEGAVFTQDYHVSGGPMLRILSLSRALKKISGELSARIAQSPFASWSGAVSLDLGGERAKLAISDGCVRVEPFQKGAVALTGGTVAASLLLGTYDPLELLGSKHALFVGEDPALLANLFPQQYPSLSAWDRF